MPRIQPVNEFRGKIDFLVIAIREDEFQAVLECFKPSYVLTGKQIYHYCEIPKSGQDNFRIAVVRTHNQGHNAAQTCASEAIHELSPAWIVLAGIAGGVPDDDFSLGDVILADHFFDLSVSAANPGGRIENRPSGGQPHSSVQRLLQFLPGASTFSLWTDSNVLSLCKPKLDLPDDEDAGCFIGDEVYRKKLFDSLRRHFDGNQPRYPVFHIAALGTSNTLVKDAELIQQWKSGIRQLKHVEMEAGGVYEAARHAAAAEIPLLSVRGISDIVGFKRDEVWTKYACKVAAAFLHSLLERIPRDFFLDLPVGNEVYESYPERERGYPSVEILLEAMKASSSPLVECAVDPDEKINRPEIDQIEGFLENKEAKAVCLLGSAGSGKSSLLADVAERLTSKKKNVFAIKADLLDAPLSNWGEQELGIEISAVDAVRAVASTNELVVIIDQLDALSSTVDLKSDRLNDVIRFIRHCTRLQDVSVICSCREIDFRRDTRFISIKAKQLHLELPSWQDVSEKLNRHGISDTTNWPNEIREVLRTPQHLAVYLERVADSSSAVPLRSYYEMLDDLWARKLRDEGERELAYSIAEYSIQNEKIWIPLVQVESQQEHVHRLQSEGILAIENGRVGFRHQTMLEHAKARLFTRSNYSLTQHVLQRQNAIFVRPTIWSVLQYLRDVDHARYHEELTRLLSAELRLHVLFLLIDFLGEQESPDEQELVHLSDLLTSDKCKLRVLKAIQGRRVWFERLCTTHFPAVMQWPAERLWLMVELLICAIPFADDEVFSLISKYWRDDSSKDVLSYHVLKELGKWNESRVDLVRKIVRRTAGVRSWWAEHLVSVISAHEPDLAPIVFLEAVNCQDAESDNISLAEAKSIRRSASVFDRNSWYDLPAIAEASPIIFLQTTWEWYVQTIEKECNGYSSSVVYAYTGHLFELDSREGEPKSSILEALFIAISETANRDPGEFARITSGAWISECQPIQRILARGLKLVVSKQPSLALDFLTSDRRRLTLGCLHHEMADSIELIRAVVGYLNVDQQKQLQQAILVFSKYREGVEVDVERDIWNREARLRLLMAIPPELLQLEVAELVNRELRELPDWNRSESRFHGGRVITKPPMTKDEMPYKSDDSILEVVCAEDKPTKRIEKWIEEKQEYEREGGAEDAMEELAEYVKVDPHRGLRLLSRLLEERNYAAAAKVVQGVIATQVSLELFVSTTKSYWGSELTEQLRSKMGEFFQSRCKRNEGLPDDICGALTTWLKMPWDTEYGRPSESEGTREADGSILWDGYGGIVQIDRSYEPLVAVTLGYLMRNEPDTASWLQLIDDLLEERVISEHTWTYYCRYLQWICLKGCDRTKGQFVIEKLFELHPSISIGEPGIQLVAMTSHYLDRQFLDLYFEKLNQTGEPIGTQGRGELLTLIAFRDANHAWANLQLKDELKVCRPDLDTDFFAVGVAHAAAHLWDSPNVRSDVSNVLCRLIPNASERVAKAICKVFWAEEDFSVDIATQNLLEAIADSPSVLKGTAIVDLTQHLTNLLPNYRHLILKVCLAILQNHGNQLNSVSFDAYGSGPHLVNIAMTLQRFDDTREEALQLLETLLQIGLDDANAILNDIDLRPAQWTKQTPRSRRRRRKSEE